MYLQIILQRTIRDMIDYHRTRFTVKYAAYQISGSIQLNHYKDFPYAFRKTTGNSYNSLSHLRHIIFHLKNKLQISTESYDSVQKEITHPNFFVKSPHDSE